MGTRHHSIFGHLRQLLHSGQPKDYIVCIFLSLSLLMTATWLLWVVGQLVAASGLAPAAVEKVAKRLGPCAVEGEFGLVLLLGFSHLGS